MPDDAAEVVRLAGLMSESMGIDPSHGSWAKRGENAVKNHVAAEVAVFVIDHPDLDGRFAACAAAVMAERLPTPADELGLVAYVQWGVTGEVCVRGGNIMVEYLRQPEATAPCCVTAGTRRGCRTR